jgi:hypothetical protein
MIPPVEKEAAHPASAAVTASAEAAEPSLH